MEISIDTRFLAYRTTEKVFAKGGLLCTKSGKKNHLEQNIFPLTKLQKKQEVEKFFAAFANLIFTEYIQPRLLQIHCYMQPELFIQIVANQYPFADEEFL